MRQRLTVILTFVVIIGLLVIINALSHVKEDDSRDLEFAPNRSTYHSGPTGLRALHDFLNESGYRVMRWREPARSEEHTSELQSRLHLVCRLLLEKKKERNK